MSQRDDVIETLIDRMPKGLSALGYGSWGKTTQEALDRDLIRITHFGNVEPMWQAEFTEHGRKVVQRYLYE